MDCFCGPVVFGQLGRTTKLANNNNVVYEAVTAIEINNINLLFITKMKENYIFLC